MSLWLTGKSTKMPVYATHKVIEILRASDVERGASIYI